MVLSSVFPHDMVDTALHRIAELIGRSDHETETLGAPSLDVGLSADRDGGRGNAADRDQKVEFQAFDQPHTTCSLAQERAGVDRCERWGEHDQAKHIAQAVPRSVTFVPYEPVDYLYAESSIRPGFASWKVKSVVARRGGFG